MSVATLPVGGLEKYDIGGTVGKGSFAVVKVGTPKDGSCNVAIKIIQKSPFDVFPNRLAEEVEIMKRVNHPNCIKLHAVFEETTKVYLVLDLVTGGELFDRIVERGSYSEKDAACLMYDIFSAIGYLHSLGIVHRDLKPENLLFASNDPNSKFYDTIKVADFGLAKLLKPELGQGTMQTMVGTPSYIAPEILERETDGYGPEVDVWSCGVILYTLLCGFMPFYDENNSVLYKQIKTADYSFPSPYWDEMSDDAKDLIMKIFQVDPKARFSIKECMGHPWITARAQASTQNLPETVKELTKMQAKKRLKKAIFTVVAANRMSFGVRGKRREMEAAAAEGAVTTADGSETVSDTEVPAAAATGATGAAAVDQGGQGKEEEGGGKEEGREGGEGREAKKHRAEGGA